jgi:hypothetical protein
MQSERTVFLRWVLFLEGGGEGPKTRNRSDLVAIPADAFLPPNASQATPTPPLIIY